MTTTPAILRTLAATTLLSLSLVGCSANQPRQQSEAAPAGTNNAEAGVATASEPQYQQASLTGQSFYQLLLAEIATNRNEFATAAELYSRLDEASSDARVAQRAAALNQLVGNYPRMRGHAEHWVELRPDMAEAWQALAIAALASGDLDAGERALERWLALAPGAEVNQALIGTAELDEEQRAALIERLDGLAETYPDNAGLPHASAQLLAENARYADALTRLERARRIEDSPSRGLLAYRLQLEQDDAEQARQTIEQLAERYPGNSQVATAYASFAYSEDTDNRAEVLESLFNRFPNEPVIARTFARESFEQGDLDTAEALFERLLDSQHADEAHYFLGRINTENARPEMAADHFLSVAEPPFLVSALAELSDLWYDDRLAELRERLRQARADFPGQGPVLWRIEAGALRSRGEPESALALLDDALDENPGNTELLYDQALIAAGLERYGLAEDNLTRVIEAEPDNASALNALGYTWADLDRNLDQARQYIDRALELEPDDPAIMDSKGWVEYRLGNLQTAEDWLRRALEAFDNDEVAAHLAEVLWVQGERDEARRWLRHAFELNAESPTASGVVERYGVEL